MRPSVSADTAVAGLGSQARRHEGCVMVRAVQLTLERAGAKLEMTLVSVKW